MPWAVAVQMMAALETGAVTLTDATMTTNDAGTNEALGEGDEEMDRLPAVDGVTVAEPGVLPEREGDAVSLRLVLADALPVVATEADGEALPVLEDATLLLTLSEVLPVVEPVADSLLAEALAELDEVAL